MHTVDASLTHELEGTIHASIRSLDKVEFVVSHKLLLTFFGFHEFVVLMEQSHEVRLILFL